MNDQFEQVEQVLIGSILGDGSINKHGAYQETHCEKQKDYLFWKRKILKKEFKINMRYKIIDKKNRDNPNYWTKQNQYLLYTRVSPLLKEYRELCYPDGKKIVSDEFIKRIGKLAIVVWYFDDGSYGVYKNGIQIHSLCFSLEENQKLQRMLKDKFGLNFHIHCCRSRKTKYPYYLACNGKDTDRFLAFIKENALYIPKSMTYKMGKLHKGNLKWIEEKRKALKNQRDSYCQKNKKLIKKSNHRYYEENKDRIKIREHEYYSNHKEKYQKYAEKRRREHPQELKEMFHRYYLKHKEKYKIDGHKRYMKNREKIKNQMQEMIAKRICTKCRKKNDSKKSKYLCKKCQDRKNMKEWMKRHKPRS